MRKWFEWVVNDCILVINCFQCTYWNGLHVERKENKLIGNHENCKELQEAHQELLWEQY